MAVRITCINKDNGNHENPHLAITHLGWINEQTGKRGKNTRLEIYNWIKEGGEAYVLDGYRKIAVVTRTSSAGTHYVKTVADGKETNNLLALMECR